MARPSARAALTKERRGKDDELCLSPSDGSTSRIHLAFQVENREQVQTVYEPPSKFGGESKMRASHAPWALDHARLISDPRLHFLSASRSTLIKRSVSSPERPVENRSSNPTTHAGRF